MHGVLASLPNMTPQALQRFREQLLATGGEKAQRDLTKKMLVRLGAGVPRHLALRLPPALLRAACYCQCAPAPPRCATAGGGVR